MENRSFWQFTITFAVIVLTALGGYWIWDYNFSSEVSTTEINSREASALDAFVGGDELSESDESTETDRDIEQETVSSQQPQSTIPTVTEISKQENPGIEEQKREEAQEISQSPSGTIGSSSVSDNATSSSGSVESQIASNQLPNAYIKFSPAGPTTEDDIKFSGAASADPDGSIAYYLWEFGNPLEFGGGNSVSSTNATATYKYPAGGSYTVRLTVFDNQGASNTGSTLITVGDLALPPAPGYSPAFTVLFQQADSSASIFHPGDGGVKYYSLGQGANGSANKLQVKFAPDVALAADGQYHLAPLVVRKTGEADPNNWLYYYVNFPNASQLKYCFVTTDLNVYKDITFTFPNALNFLSANTYEVGFVYLQNSDAPANHDVCGNQESVGNGNARQGNFKGSGGGAIYFQIGN